MGFKRHPDVLVVGAGPVGLYTALLLAERGHEVEIIDEEWRTGAHSYALALHPHSLALMDRIGLTEQLVARGQKVRTVGLYQGAERRGEAHLEALPGDHKYVLVLPQDELESLLEEQLNKNGVKVRWNHRLRWLAPGTDRAAFEVDALTKETSGYGFAKTEWVVEKTRQGDAAFVVGADGHRSAVRRFLHVPVERVGEPQTFAVFEIATDGNIPAEVRFVLDDELTSVYWPLGEGRCRWSFEIKASTQSPVAQERAKSRLCVQVGSELFPYLSGDDLMRWLRERAPWFQADVKEIDWATSVQFERRLAESAGEGRVWLAGDAIHTTGPAGAQSMNVGFQEGFDLAWRISGALFGDVAPEAFVAYGQERRAQWRQLLGLEGGLVTRADTSPWIAARAARLLPALPASGEGLGHLANQLGLDLVR